MTRWAAEGNMRWGRAKNIGSSSKTEQGLRLKKSDTHFQDGETIFREGEPSRSAYAIVEGDVELTKESEKGRVTLAILKPGEMLGEMGIFDQSPRSATARAVGNVTVNKIGRDEFLESLKEEPDAAFRFIGKLVERLRTTNELLVKGPTIEVPAPDQSVKPGFLDRLLGMRPGTGARHARPKRIEIRVVPLDGDADSRVTRHVVAAVGKRRRVKARIMKEVLDTNSAIDPVVQVNAVTAKGRRLLAKDQADLMIWGDVDEPGTSLHLRFVPAEPEDEDLAGTCGPIFPINLPVNFGPEFADILFTAALAAIVPADEGKEKNLALALPKALEAALPAVQELPRDLTSRERATILVSTANVAATLARNAGAVELYQMAAQNYRAGLETMTRDAAPLEWAMIQRNLGMVLQALAERMEDAEILGTCADCYRDALKVLTKAQFPRPWAATQNRLGMVLYKLDLKTGDTELVKHSLATFQAALQVYTRADHPMRWAEVMNNFGQVAQMLGGQLRNAEVLEKAAEACRGALEVRTREETPLLWAATQNNLGSAMFLLGKLSGEILHLEGAAEAFRQAHGLYRTYGATRMVSITEKNLSHVERLLAARAPRGVPKMSWEGEEAQESADIIEEEPPPEVA